MKSISRHLTAFALVSGLTGGFFASTAAAQEQVASDLVLRKTYMKTDDTLFTPPYAFGMFPVFTPTTVNCPGGGTCTVRIEVSGEMSVTSGDIYGRV